MKMTIKKVADVYKVLSSAKLSKLKDEEKFKIIKQLRKLKPVHDKYNADVEDARERLKGDEHESVEEDTRLLTSLGEKSGVAIERIAEVNLYWRDYNRRVDLCVKEEGDREIDLDIEPMTAEIQGKLLASNDFTIDNILEIDILFVEPENN